MYKSSIYYCIITNRVRIARDRTYVWIREMYIKYFKEIPSLLIVKENNYPSDPSIHSTHSEMC